MASTPEKSRKVSGVIGVASVILVVLTLLAGVVLQFGIGGNTDAANATPNSGTIAFNPKTDLVPDDAKCTDNGFIKSSSQSVKAGDKNYRQFATAVSIPFTGASDDAVNKEIISEICGNPTYLKMVVDDMMLWTGFPGAEENKAWLKTIQDDIATHGLDPFVLKETDSKKLIVTEQFQEYAGWVNTVLLRFNTNGEQSLTSVRNWEVPATSDPTVQPIAVQASTQESKPAWVRTLADKNGTCLYKIGFNSEDKRIETFNCITETPGTPGTPGTPETPGTPGTPGTPETPGCTSDCGGTPPECTTDCGGTPPPPWKGPASEDPYPQGNAPTGGGQNADPGPGTYVPPTEVQQPPAEPYVPPAAPSSGGSQAPAVPPSGPSEPAPSTDTGGQSNNGTVPSTGSGASCNPVVMSC